MDPIHLRTHLHKKFDILIFFHYWTFTMINDIGNSKKQMTTLFNLVMIKAMEFIFTIAIVKNIKYIINPYKRWNHYNRIV